MRRLIVTATMFMATTEGRWLTTTSLESTDEQQQQDWMYKTEWPECEGLKANACRNLIQKQLEHHVLGNRIQIGIQRHKALSSQHSNEVDIVVNRQDAVIGRNYDGKVSYPFLWQNGETLGPWDCLGFHLKECCSLIQRDVPPTVDGVHIGCHVTALTPVLHFQPTQNAVWYQEYRYDPKSDQIQLVDVEPPEHVPLIIEQGSDGKVHDTPQLANVVLERGYNPQMISASVYEANLNANEWMSQIQASQTPAELWKNLLPVLLSSLAACFCCCGMYYLCCVPIKDEEYIMDTQKVMESVNERMGNGHITTSTKAINGDKV